MDDATRNIRILVVDDHPMLREGIAAILEQEPDMVLIGEAETGERAIESYRRLRPDVVLMDIQMPKMNGLAAMKAIRQEFPASRFIVLTTYSGDVQAVNALKAGASGYLLKNALGNELLDAIRATYAGRKFISSEIAREIAVHAIDDHLTEREVNILLQISEGGSNKAIARKLSISEDSVKAHLKSIFSKLDVNDRTEAVVIAARRGIITL